MADRTPEMPLLQLMLEDASIKLSSVAARLSSVSARAMLGALLAGNATLGRSRSWPRARCGPKCRS